MKAKKLPPEKRQDAMFGIYTNLGTLNFARVDVLVFQRPTRMLFVYYPHLTSWERVEAALEKWAAAVGYDFGDDYYLSAFRVEAVYLSCVGSPTFCPEAIDLREWL